MEAEKQFEKFEENILKKKSEQNGAGNGR
jgi:hypothetical protein